jgi:hypothetical protein
VLLLYEMLLMSWLAGDILASEEGPYCMELVRALFRGPVHYNVQVSKSKH